LDIATRILPWLLLSIALSTLLPVAVNAGSPAKSQQHVALDQLPAEARATIQLVRQGGPFRYAMDGAVFGNREHRLPSRERGWYREFTVAIPDRGDRGADRGKLRIIAGRDGVFYYSADHYQSFRRVRE
jgi:ribonuclease T1